MPLCVTTRKRGSAMKQKTKMKKEWQNAETVPAKEMRDRTKVKSLSDNQINLSDFALFLSVMKVKEAYEDVLSIILDETDLKLKEVKVEHVILNKSGKRAIRLDAWALDIQDRQFDMEMQNDTTKDDVRKRSRFYQSIIDTPILKSGRETRYKNLPSTAIIFITQDDIFGRNQAIYTFSERCEEVPDLRLEDGTCKIFLNMTSKNGRPELISLLQYMKYSSIDNENIIVRDKRILDLDRIVTEVKQSEEWEAVEMNIFEIGVERGIEEGSLRTLIKNVELSMKNFHLNLQEACDGLEITVDDYEKAKQQILQWENANM